LLVDDHPLIREGLIRHISKQHDMEVCAQANTAHEALRAAAAHQPDLAIVDLALGEDDGMDLVRDLRARYPKTEALVLSMHDETFYAERALRAGAMGYVMKQERLQTVIEAIRKILDGEVFLSPRMTARTVRRFSGRTKPEEKSLTDSLSDREFQIFRLLGEGLGPTAIAQRLHISVKTVETHREHIKTKLNLVDASMLRQCAIQWAQQQLATGSPPA
jgi:DNA-binding NarL/FixJ family response regulator